MPIFGNTHFETTNQTINKKKKEKISMDALGFCKLSFELLFREIRTSIKKSCSNRDGGILYKKFRVIIEVWISPYSKE